MEKIIGANGKPYPLDDVLGAVGKGWTPLVKNLVEDLFELGWDGHLFQIKEKFGGLRFYIDGGSAEIFARIEKAEAESVTVCERCGNHGEVRPLGWLRTLCDDCLPPQ